MTEGTAQGLSGTARLTVPFRSARLGRDVGLQVYQPPEDGDRQRHPVLYVHDGQNLFGGEAAFVAGQSWDLDATADHLIRAGAIAPVIIVGIDHAGAGRIDEFAPTRQASGQGGGGVRYARFLVEELKPFIDSHFHTEPWTASTAMAGSSMGGLVTLVAGLQYPWTFGGLGVMSPSVWWDHRGILRAVRARPLRARPRIWLDIGLGEPPRAIEDARALRKVLVREGWTDRHDLRYEEDRDGDHAEGSWARRAGPMLQFLFPPRGGAGATIPAAGGPGLR